MLIRTLQATMPLNDFEKLNLNFSKFSQGSVWQLHQSFFILSISVEFYYHYFILIRI